MLVTDEEKKAGWVGDRLHFQCPHATNVRNFGSREETSMRFSAWVFLGNMTVLVLDWG